MGMIRSTVEKRMKVKHCGRAHTLYGHSRFAYATIYSYFIRSHFVYMPRILHNIGHAQRDNSDATTNCYVSFSAIFLPSPNRNLKFLYKNINFLSFYAAEWRWTSNVTLSPATVGKVLASLQFISLNFHFHCDVTNVLE